MVKIRYAELPAGLHVATEAGDRCTIVYLKPGLTRAQRKDALIVARRSARFGHGPSLPPLDMAFALAADRTRTATRIVTSVLRNHPMLLLPLLALVLGIIATSILASAAIVTVTPGASPARSDGLYQFNVGELSRIGGAPIPGSDVPSPSPAQPAAGGPVLTGPHSSHAHHGRGHSRSHVPSGAAQAPTAGTAQAPTAGPPQAAAGF